MAPLRKFWQPTQWIPTIARGIKHCNFELWQLQRFVGFGSYKGTCHMILEIVAKLENIQ